MKTISINKKQRESDEQKKKASELERYLNLAYGKMRNYSFVSQLMENRELILSQTDEELKRIGAMIYLLCKSMYFDYEVTFGENGITVEVGEWEAPF